VSLIESTYKARDVEETIDIYFYRPLGFIVANMCRIVKITPNTVTVLSIIVGLIGSHLLYYSDLFLNVVGLLLWVIADIFDSADGQLARMINNKSKLGRILDGLAANIIFLSMYLHLYARMVASGSSPWFFIIILAAGFSHSIQSALADYYRNAYLKFVVDPMKSELESSDDIRKEYDAVSIRGNVIRKFLLRIYLNYTIEQEAFAKNFQKLRLRVSETFGNNIPQWFADEYRRQNKPLMKYYAILTTNTRMIVMACCVILNHVPMYFWIELVVINLIMVLVTNHQEKLSKQLLMQIDERKA
jgi:phosphatidylglycerophosphate synthase